MKFEEKLFELRKKKGLSQEELGSKLSVTVQTISKWESGQSKPSAKKIEEISKLFNVNINMLNEEENISVAKLDDNNEDDVRPRKWLLILLIIVAIIILILLINKAVVEKKSSEGNKSHGIFDIFKDFDDFDKKSFNSKFELYSGSQSGFFLENLLDNVITSNKTETNIIKVVYGKVNTSDENEIRKLKKSFDNFTEYEVIIDYDDKGYVSQITIED